MIDNRMVPEVYSPEQAALLLGCGKTTIFKLLKEKKIDHRKLGNKTLIIRADLEAFIKNLPSSKSPENAA